VGCKVSSVAPGIVYEERAVGAKRARIHGGCALCLVAVLIYVVCQYEQLRGER
jgi:hypothetical protein